MSVFTDHDKRLQALVKASVGGFVRLYQEIEADSHETAYVVLWVSDNECGTHRACLANESDDAMLVWGHYFRGPTALSDASRDFDRRLGLS